MGGSSLPWDIINNIFSQNCEIKFLRDYDIPQKDDYSDDFYIIASFSGNTEETLSCLEKIEKVTSNFVILANWWKLQEIAEFQKYPFLRVPDCKQPRIASGYFFTFLIVILSQLSKIDLNWFEELQNLSDFIESETWDLEIYGKNLSKKLHNYLPIIYSDENLYSMARIRKINFNENSKTQSFWNTYPELNHNELVGYTNLITKPYIINLISQFIHTRNLKRISVTQKILWDKINFENIYAKWKNQLQEVFWCYVLGGFTSYYLALEYGVDPMPVKMVEDFKKFLKE